MASPRGTSLPGWLAAGTALITVAACSSDPPPSLSAPSLKELSTGAGKVLTISPDQLLAATSGVTPVAFGKPAHGNIAYGAYGAMIYTPDAASPARISFRSPSATPSGSTPRTRRRC
ncbi:hypothetical protein [Mycobacterium interjectum]|uniref:hypothetical protein n=1 Tax=Mycobacterium interjectum TaxID=33895 RepID=UPI0021F2E39A|nr:hypothetical protein [Mycobacterium interjectum]